MAIAAGVLLTLYLLAIVGVLLMPSRSHDPQRGQAIGCLMIVAIGIALLGGVLGLAVWLDQNWLVEAIFWMGAFPMIILAVNAARYLLMKLR
jgi:hypothetical protein